MSSEKVKETPNQQPSAPSYPVETAYPVQSANDGMLFFFLLNFAHIKTGS